MKRTGRRTLADPLLTVGLERSGRSSTSVPDPQRTLTFYIFSARLECGDHRTSDGSFGRAAVVDQPCQDRFDAMQVCEFLAYIFQLVLSECPSLVAVCAVLQLQQSGHLVQTETQPLPRLHELNPRHVRRAIAVDAAVGPVRFRQQPLR